MNSNRNSTIDNTILTVSDVTIRFFWPLSFMRKNMLDDRLAIIKNSISMISILKISSSDIVIRARFLFG